MLNKIIKKIIHSNNILFRIYYKFIWSSRDILDKFLFTITRKNLTFIQIGANDGKWNDPIYKFIRMDRWVGILIEPQKDIFEKLIKNYSNCKNLIFENCAIGPEDGKMNLYRISFTNAKWASGLSSFNREDVQRMIDAGYVERNAIADKIELPDNKENWIRTESVEVLSFLSLIKKHNYKNIDLLMLDVEGFEYEIISTIPFEQVEIKTIVYEHSHFNADKKELIMNFLRNKGYSFKTAQSDTIAIKTN